MRLRKETVMQHTKTRSWHWKVEPGMEDAFHDLQAWLLSGQRDAEIESQAMVPGNPSFRTCCRTVQFRCCARAVA